MNPLDPKIIIPELHAALGAGFLAFFWLFVPHAWFWVAFVLLEEVLLVKEIVFDPREEGATQPFFWEGAKDFAEYHLGYAFFGACAFFGLHL